MPGTSTGDVEMIQIVLLACVLPGFLYAGPAGYIVSGILLVLGLRTRMWDPYVHVASGSL